MLPDDGSSADLTFTNCAADLSELTTAHTTGDGTRLIVSLTATRRCASCIVSILSDIV